jgi:outer membrane murein-binding lipoprotein Lpp
MRPSQLYKLFAVCVMIGILAGCASMPVQHPNLAAAQQDIQGAIDKLAAAQGANDFDMKGHAAKAKRLLEQALNEIQLAGQAANSYK